MVAVATFAIIRLIDHLVVPRDFGLSSRAGTAYVASQQQQQHAPCPTVMPASATAAPLPVVGAASAAPPRRRREPHFAIIGFPVGIDERNRARRQLLRDLWYPEYANLGPDERVRCEFVIGLLTYQGDGHEEAIVEQLHSEHVEHRDLALVNAREATRDPYRGDPKCTGEKIIAWFQQCVVVHRGTRFFIKAGARSAHAACCLRLLPPRIAACDQSPIVRPRLPDAHAHRLPDAHAHRLPDAHAHRHALLTTTPRVTTRACPDWDSWIHTMRLEVNLRTQLAPRAGPLYFGNTLWCSYSLEDFQPCGYGFGPLQAAGAKKAECPLLPKGRNAIGPYPYTAGLMWGMSYELVQWIAGSRLVYDFWQNASSRYEPPYWVKGEDSAFGFFAHIAPFPNLTPIHWGWHIVHDGYEFRSPSERGLCTQHISNTTLAVHSMHTPADFQLVVHQLRERCDATCEQATLPFTVDGLADLCQRNPNIPKAYSKCANVLPGTRMADDGSAANLPMPLRRPKCSSVGSNVPFIAAKKDGGTIECKDEEPSKARQLYALTGKST